MGVKTELIFNIIFNNWLLITILLSFVVIFFSFFLINPSFSGQGNDKYLHIVAYLFLSFSAAFRKPINYILIFSYFFLFGLVIELIQPYFDRHFELLDIIANSIGTLLAITFAGLLRKYYSY